MTATTARFDGRALILDEPVDLTLNQRVFVRFEPIDDKATNFDAWIGLASRGPQNPNPRFKSDDDLWKKG